MIFEKTRTEYTLKERDFTVDQLKLFDIHCLQRHGLLITVKYDLTDKDFLAISEIIGSEYSLPMKYLKPDLSACRYISQKSQLFGDENNMENASITIEPLNNNIFNTLIAYIPINQNLPLGTMFTLNVETPYQPVGDNIPEQLMLYSDIIVTDENIGEIIPFNRSIELGSIDVGSKLFGKFVVSDVDLSVSMSRALFSFKRPAINKFEIITYDYVGKTPEDILRMIASGPAVSEYTAKFINTILK